MVLLLGARLVDVIFPPKTVLLPLPSLSPSQPLGFTDLIVLAMMWDYDSTYLPTSYIQYLLTYLTLSSLSVCE